MQSEEKIIEVKHLVKYFGKFKAVEDVSFDVFRGDVYGFLGPNGAGKSTLLKILSKVTGPTTGRIDFDGRIGSLLEVGTGFHSELTGRENIFLNGAILGMTKTEIRSKLDEIIDFSGCERYIDTPVKRYSSGMMVRLGFAVAAHLEPEILVVDEVLAVGDAEFQKKAIGKMQDVSRNDGRTILFVSHNMAAVKSLCSRGIILKNGSSFFEGIINQCVSTYLKGDNALVNHKIWQNEPEIKSDNFELKEIGISSMDKDYEDFMHIDEPLEFKIKFTRKNPDKRLHITLHLKDDLGNKLFSTGSEIIEKSDDVKEENFQASVVFPANFFNWGTLYIDLLVVEDLKHVVLIINDIISFTLLNKKAELGEWMGREPGAIMPVFDWNLKQITN